MDITWYGSTCFRFAKRGLASVVTNPSLTGEGTPDLAADIVTFQHRPEQIPDLPGKPYLITGPGEYEVGGVFVTGIQSGNAPRATLYVYQFDPLTIADLGTVERIPSQAEVETIGTVNVLIVPAGGTGGWTASQAVELISRLEPNLVIPIYQSEDALNKFLKEMGLTDIPYQPMLKVVETSLPENTKVILLENQGVRRSSP